MKKVKSVKGITLVALVITIIILLILAGISISALTNQGLFEKATEAKQKSENAQKDENEKIGNYIAQIYAIELKNVDTNKTNPEAAMPAGAEVVNGDANNGIVIRDSNNNEWTWVEVPKDIYINAKGEDDYNNIEADLVKYAEDYRKGSSTQQYNWKDEWYAIDGDTIVTKNTSGLTDEQKALNNGCGLTYSEYEEMYHKMLSSVYKNGGFWISRYEIGDSTATESNTTRTKNSGTTGVAVSKSNQIPYNYITCSEAQSLATKFLKDTSKTSSLLFGIQWDLTCKFIQEKGNLELNDINKNSNWGNYWNVGLTLYRGKYNTEPHNSAVEWKLYSEDTPGHVVNKKTLGTDSTTRQLLTTGASENANKMNIYDFAGNEWEWTLEYADSGERGHCAERGGMYGNPKNISASFRYGNSNSEKGEGTGFRLTCY